MHMMPSIARSIAQQNKKFEWSNGVRGPRRRHAVCRIGIVCILLQECDESPFLGWSEVADALDDTAHGLFRAYSCRSCACLNGRFSAWFQCSVASREGGVE